MDLVADADYEMDASDWAGSSQPQLETMEDISNDMMAVPGSNRTEIAADKPDPDVEFQDESSSADHILASAPDFVQLQSSTLSVPSSLPPGAHIDQLDVSAQGSHPPVVETPFVPHLAHTSDTPVDLAYHASTGVGQTDAQTVKGPGVAVGEAAELEDEEDELVGEESTIQAIPVNDGGSENLDLDEEHDASAAHEMGDEHGPEAVRVTFNGQDFVIWSSADIPSYLQAKDAQASQVEEEQSELDEIEAPALNVSEDVLWQPLDCLFVSLREKAVLGDFLEEFSELVLSFTELKLEVHEDNVYCRDITLDDLMQLHHGLGYTASLHIAVSERPRFITKYNELAQHVAKILGSQMEGSDNELEQTDQASNPINPIKPPESTESRAETQAVSEATLSPSAATADEANVNGDSHLLSDTKGENDLSENVLKGANGSHVQEEIPEEGKRMSGEERVDLGSAPNVASGGMIKAETLSDQKDGENGEPHEDFETSDVAHSPKSLAESGTQSADLERNQAQAQSHHDGEAISHQIDDFTTNSDEQGQQQGQEALVGDDSRQEPYLAKEDDDEVEVTEADEDEGKSELNEQNDAQLVANQGELEYGPSDDGEAHDAGEEDELQEDVDPDAVDWTHQQADGSDSAIGEQAYDEEDYEENDYEEHDTHEVEDEEPPMHVLPADLNDAISPEIAAPQKRLENTSDKEDEEEQILDYIDELDEEHSSEPVVAVENQADEAEGLLVADSELTRKRTLSVDDQEADLASEAAGVPKRLKVDEVADEA